MERVMKVLEKFVIDYPFVRHVSPPVFGEAEVYWVGGCTIESDECDIYRTCNGVGQIIFEILAIVELPGKYQNRVLYRVTMIEPEGKVRKKNEVKCITITKFKQCISGYGHEYEVEKADE